MSRSQAYLVGFSMGGVAMWLVLFVLEWGSRNMPC